ncbi:MAG: hypothetical protein ACE5EA_04885 [Nitrospirota bacterium]
MESGMTIRFRIMIFLSFFSVIFFYYNINAYSIKPSIPIDIELSMDGVPAVGGEVSLTLRVTPLIDAPDIKVLYHIPEGLDIVSGEKLWNGSMSKGEEIELRIRARIPDLKRYIVIGGAAIEFSDGSKLGDSKSILIDPGVKEKPDVSATRLSKDKDGNPVIEYKGESRIRVIK